RPHGTPYAAGGPVAGPAAFRIRAIAIADRPGRGSQSRPPRLLWGTSPTRGSPMKTVIATMLSAAALVAAAGFAQAQPKKEVTIAHQDMNVPYRVAIDSGEIEKATGYKINWKF